MNPLTAYKQNQSRAATPTRIELLLQLYDGGIERLNKAIELIRAGDDRQALMYKVRVQLIVMQLSAGVRMEVDQEIGANMLRLYEYVGHQLRKPKVEALEDALRILNTLREGFMACREEANRLERSGQLPSVDDMVTVAAQA